MSKFNKVVKNKNKTVNYEGDVAYNMGDELELYTLVCTASLQNKFYESANDTMDRLRSLISSVDPEFSAKLAIYAREEMYLRSVPVVMAVELASKYPGNSWVSKLVERVIQRPDEITEVLSYYQSKNNRTGTKKLNKLSNQIKKGIKNVFQSGKFDEYQYSKYNRKQDVRLRDALFLTHPKPVDNEQKLLFDRIANDTLKIACTWETQMSEAGKKDSPVTSKKDVWEKMILSEKMGYMAVLRNLSNFLKNDISKECMEMVCDYLSNPVAVKNSKQLPFRFLSAYRILTGSFYSDGLEYSNSPYLNMVLESLEKAIRYSIFNIPMFDNDNVLIATDVSASMQSRVSPNSVVNMYDIGTVLAMMMNSKCKYSVSGMFGDTWKVVNFPKENILMNANEIYRREGEVGYSTNGHKVLKWAVDNKNHSFDKIMIFTDCQLWDSYGNLGAMKKYWKQYKKENPNTKLYMFDLTGYGNTPIDVKDNDVFLISGWSDKIFDILSMFDKGLDAVDKIRQVKFDM